MRSPLWAVSRGRQLSVSSGTRHSRWTVSARTLDSSATCMKSSALRAQRSAAQRVSRPPNRRRTRRRSRPRSIRRRRPERNGCRPRMPKRLVAARLGSATARQSQVRRAPFFRPATSRAFLACAIVRGGLRRGLLVPTRRSWDARSTSRSSASFARKSSMVRIRMLERRTSRRQCDICRKKFPTPRRLAPRAELWPPRCHDHREDDGRSRLGAIRRGTSEPADIPHEIAQGRATPEVSVRARRPVRIPLGSQDPE
jgi:hypothetical protein